MTPDELAAIRARAEAATEGPWVQNGCNGIHTAIGSCVALTYRHDDGQRKADAEFIAHTRQDIPDLLAAVDAVREVHAEGEFGCPYPSHGCNDFYYRGNYCPDAGTSCEACGEKYPCPTIRALGGDS